MSQGWTDPLSNQLIPVANATLQIYNITGTTNFQLSWPQNNEPNPVATTNIFTGVGTNMLLPNPNDGGADYTFYLVNRTNGTKSIKTQDGIELYSLPVLGVIMVILSNPFAVTQDLGFEIVPMNVGSSILTNLDTVVSPTINDQNNVLNTQVHSIPILAGGTYAVTSYTGNDLYTVEIAPSDFAMGTPGNSDIGKLVTFKNLSSGTVTIDLPANNKADAMQNDTSEPGVSSISLNFSESVTMMYTGLTTLADSSVIGLWVIVCQKSNTGVLYLDSTLLLAATPPSSPVVMNTAQVNSDVIYFSVADPAHPPSGVYDFTVPSPVAKVYYMTLDPLASNANVRISFGVGGTGKEITLSSSNGGFYQFFIASDGSVVVGTSIVNVQWATQAEVNAGTQNLKGVTPATLSGRTATTTRTGILALATNAEALALTEATKAITASNLGALTASTTQRGIGRYATNAETLAQTAADLAVTPAALASLIATPAEAQAGTNAVKYITPSVLASLIATLAEAQAGTNAVKYITPSVLASIITDNGGGIVESGVVGNTNYIEFENGYKIMRGKFIVNLNSNVVYTTIFYPISFSSPTRVIKTAQASYLAPISDIVFTNIDNDNDNTNGTQLTIGAGTTRPGTTTLTIEWTAQGF